MFEDPRKVLMDVEGLEWDPKISIAKAIDLATDALQNPPVEIEFSVKLTGTSAGRFHFIKTIMTALGLPNEEADKFLLMSGVEQQFRMLAEKASISNE